MKKRYTKKRKAAARKRKMIKSPLRYPGGKSRAINNIMEHIPNFNEYREPFLGGGSVYLYLSQLYPERKFWVNDLYFDLSNFWLQARDDLDAVATKVMKWRQHFSDGKDLHRFLRFSMNRFNETEKAAAFFVFNRITFSGTTHSGGYSEDAFRNRFTESSIERLISLKDVLKNPNTTITNVDYHDLLVQDGENVFIFLDPPYHSATKSALYGKNGNLHKAFDHERFAATVAECKHKYLITYDDSNYIRDLYSFANVSSWNLTYGMRNVTQGTTQTGNEVFISNCFSEPDATIGNDTQNYYDDKNMSIA